MKNPLLLLALGVAVGVLSTLWIGARHKTEPETPVQKASETSDPLHLDGATQARMGMETRAVQSARAATEIRADARVQDSAPLLQIWNSEAVFQLDHRNARHEWERLKTLYDSGQIASARELDMAETAMKRDEVLIRDAGMRLSAAAGATLASRTNFPETAEQLSRFEAALVRIEFPPGTRWNAPAGSLRLLFPGSPDSPIPFEWLGSAPNTDPLTQGPAFLVIAHTNGLSPGTSLVALAAVNDSGESGVLIPASAVVHHEGGTFVYGMAEADRFVRLPIVLGPRIGDGWLATSGVTNGQSIVVTGAQMLLSSELKSRDGEE